MIKTIKIRILLMIVVLGNVSIQGMFLSKTRQFKKVYTPVKTKPSTTSDVIQPMEFKDMGIGQKLQNWYSNFIATFSSQKPVSGATSYREVSRPFATGIQTRSYSSPVPAQPGFWAKFASFFESKKPIILEQQQQQIAVPYEQSLTLELQSKGLGGIMHELLYPQHTKRLVDRAGLTRDIRVFDESDLEKAKEKINSILALNEDYKTSMVLVMDTGTWRKKNLRTEDSLFRTVLYSHYGYTDVWNSQGSKVIRYGFEGTLLDEVLYRIFSGESSTSFYTTTESLLNYIKLAQWLMDTGVRINENNEKKYMLGYVEYLMSAYKRLYEPESFVRDTMTFIDEDSFKKIFEELDPILEKLLSNPELKQELREIQKERQEIEANPQAFREKLEEEARRQEYIREIGDILQWEYIFRTGDMNRDTSSFNKEVEFDEAEYQEWKKTGFLGAKYEALKRKQQWRWHKSEESWEQSGKKHNEQDKDILEKKISMLKDILKLPSDASSAMIVQAATNYIKRNHPDALQSRQDISPEKKAELASDYTNFMGEYDNIIKILKKRKDQEQENIG